MTEIRYILIAATFLATQLWAGEHWAFQPIVKAQISEGNGIDYFLEREFQKNEVQPNPEADHHTLLRRLTISLTGLPPTRKEIDQFLADDSPEAYEKLVERLLHSPHYGERWGRHWLDVARYVPGKIKVPGVDHIDLAEEYRDYVVRAFNADKPYDRFLTEQLAGDLLTGETTDFLDLKVAPAFLSIGPWFDECTDPNKLKLDIADEQISTVTKAFLGLDFACSRCHDHKFDPIPTRDYYAMAGIFRSTRIVKDFNEFWKDGRHRLTQPLARPEVLETFQKKQRAIANLEKERWSLLNRKRTAFISENEAAFKFTTASSLNRQLNSWEAEDFSGQKNLRTVEGKYSPAIETQVPLEQWVQYDFDLNQAGNFLLYLRYATPKTESLKLELNRVLQTELLALANTGGVEYQHYRWEAFGPFPFQAGSNHIRLLVDQHHWFPRLDALKIVNDDRPAPESALDRAKWRLSHSRTFWPPMSSEMELILPPGDLADLALIDQKIAAFKAGSTSIKETIAVTDQSEMIDEPIRVGGNTYQIEGDPVPRGIPTLFNSNTGEFAIPEGASGRLELARWMTAPQNTLTARVMVNRLWHWHFGKGLVATTDNFGKKGAKPENAALLDWLATEFMESGWSVKHIQRLIVTSEAYRRTSQPAQTALLASFPKRRLEAEVIYDGMLGALDKVVRQPSGNPLNTNLSRDRALYVLVSSRSPLGLGVEIRKMFNLFGYDPSGRPLHTRPDVVTPDQALFFLNNPLPKYYADKLADQLMGSGLGAKEAITPAFLAVLGHPPDELSASAALAYVTDSLRDQLSEKEALSRMISGLFSCDEFTHLY